MEEAHLNLYRSLNKNRVKYLLIGGMAAVLYGSPRLTKDIDILIEPTLENASRLLKALKEIGFVTVELTNADKMVKNEITIFKDYIRLDVLTKIKGIDFLRAWNNKVIKRIEGTKLYLMNLDDLIVSKKSVARELDLEDVVILKKIKKRLKKK